MMWFVPAVLRVSLAYSKLILKDPENIKSINEQDWVDAGWPPSWYSQKY